LGYRKNKEILKAIGRGLRQAPEVGPYASTSADIELSLRALQQAEAADKAGRKVADVSLAAKPVVPPLHQYRLRST
jgi:hypothetical protein